MGEICKDPDTKKTAQANTIEGTKNILLFLIESEGAQNVLRGEQRANRGTIARLINQDVFDINIENGADKTTDSTASRGEQRANKGR